MKFMRYAILITGLASLLLALGYIWQVPFVTAMWPWTDGRLSYLFVGSILASASASMLWIGWTGKLSALTGGVLNILVITVGSSIYFVRLSILEERTALLPYTLAVVLMALASSLIFVWSRTFPRRDSAPTPRPVLFSFGIFLVALLLAAVALILRLPIFPWAVNPDSSVIFGCIFLGNATYFLYGLLFPRWDNALGQLLSFLAYDLVLIVPFLLLFPTIKPEFLLSLVVYVAVLLYSGSLAVYYLFAKKETRILKA